MIWFLCNLSKLSSRELLRCGVGWSVSCSLACITFYFSACCTTLNLAYWFMHFDGFSFPDHQINNNRKQGRLIQHILRWKTENMGKWALLLVCISRPFFKSLSSIKLIELQCECLALKKQTTNQEPVPSIFFPIGSLQLILSTLTTPRRRYTYMRPLSGWALTQSSRVYAYHYINKTVP